MIAPLRATAAIENAQQIDFNIDPITTASVGLTLRPLTEPQWAGLLEELVARRLCTRKRASAAMGWLKQGSAPAAYGATSYLSHVKVTWIPNGLKAKLYFGVKTGTTHAIE